MESEVVENNVTFRHLRELVEMGNEFLGSVDTLVDKALLTQKQDHFSDSKASNDDTDSLLPILSAIDMQIPPAQEQRDLLSSLLYQS